MSRPPSRPRTAWKWRNSRDVESLLLRRGGSPDEGKRNPGMVYPAFRSAPCALHQTIVALYLLKGGTASPSPSPLWGGSIAEAKRRRSGWGWVLRCVECAPRSTSTPTPLASLATLPTRGRVFPIHMSKWQAVARMERSEIRGRRDRPTRIPLRSMRATNKPAVHFRFTCQIARAANAAPPGENGCRAPPIVLFSVSPRGWERRGRRVRSTYRPRFRRGPAFR